MRGIVIIEDDALMRLLLADWLTADGYRVRRGESLSLAPAPELVIVDVCAPRHSGVERMRAVRAAHPGVPIIAISGHFRSGVQSTGPVAEALGVERVIAKPFGRDRFLVVVRSVIGTPRRRDAGTADAAVDQDAPPGHG